MKQFPESFLKCFTHSDDEVTPDKFLDLLDFPAEECLAVAQMLCHFVRTCTQDGMFIYIRH